MSERSEVDRRVNAMQTSGVIELSEQLVIEEIAQRLAQMYPELPAGTIAEVVRNSHGRFDGRPVRDFIPLFVERECRRRLAEFSA